MLIGWNRYMKYMDRPQYTPNAIDSLKEDEVFVFGSNLKGMHGGGAAYAAYKKFGAVMGQGVGLQGQSYAIPTMQGGVETIKPYVDEFIEFVKQHKELFFYVTRIGCGIAGFKDEEIAPLFARAAFIGNVSLPISFASILNEEYDDNSFPGISMSAAYRLQCQGQAKTIVDIITTLNDDKHYTDFAKLMDDLKEVINKYQRRGTVSADVCHRLYDLLSKNNDNLFKNGYLDFDRLIELVDENSTSPLMEGLDEIYSMREKTKILRLANAMNEICHYEDPDEFIYELAALTTGRWNCGDNNYMNDSYRYPLQFVFYGIKHLWNKITKEGILDNELLKKYMFTEHERKVAAIGLSEVIRTDFENDGPCHPEVFYPKVTGTAPVYVVDPFNTEHCTGNPMYVKSCGEGKGPNAWPYRYEFMIIKPLLERQVQKGTYEKVEEFYFPIKEWRTRPIFHELYGKIEIHGLREKMRFMTRIRRGEA